MILLFMQRSRFFQPVFIDGSYSSRKDKPRSPAILACSGVDGIGELKDANTA